MSDNANSSPWRFLAARAFWAVSPTRGRELVVSESSEFLKSYLDRFECVPVNYGHPNQRKLAKYSNIDKKWTLTDPAGDTELEAAPVSIEEANVFKVLTENSWFHIGYFFLPTLIEFEFNVDGSGFSRWAKWGHNTITPSIEDYFWNFSIKQGILAIKWEDGTDVDVEFNIVRHLRVASSHSSGGLSFYDFALNVSVPLFPATCGDAQYLLKEYWGKFKKG